MYGTPTVTVTDGTENNVGTVTEYKYGSRSAVAVMQKDVSSQFSFVNYIQVSDLTITKELLGEIGAANGASYDITISLNGSPYTGKAYLNDTEVQITNGRYSLKQDDSLVIKNIPNNTTYSVEESDLTSITPAGFSYNPPQYNGNEVAPTNVVLKEDILIEIFNELIAVFGDLKITKKGIDTLDHHIAEGQNKEEKQSTIYVISGKSDSGKEVYLEVVIVGGTDTDGESVVIKNLPVGTYTVHEKTEWSWRYATENDHKVTVTGGAEAATTFENERIETQWLSGDSWCSNWWESLTNIIKNR